MNLTVQALERQGARIQDLNFNISEMELSITSLYIISDAPEYDNIWTENSNVIDSFISESKYVSSVIKSLTEKTKTVLFTPKKIVYARRTRFIFVILIKRKKIYNLPFLNYLCDL